MPPEVIYYLVFQADIFSQVTRSSSPDRGVLFFIVFFFFKRGLYMSACVLKGWNSVCLSSGVRVDPVVFCFFFGPRPPAIDVKREIVCI